MDFAILTRPQEPVSAEFAAQQSDTAQLLVLSENAAQALATLHTANASIELLRETTKLPWTGTAFAGADGPTAFCNLPGRS